MKVQGILIMVASLLMACQGSNNDVGPVNKDGQPIIGPQFDKEKVDFEGRAPSFVVMLQLNEPALLGALVKKADGTVEIDPVAKQAVLAEQAQMEQTLKSISQDVKVITRFRLALNALAVEAPQAVADQINALDLAYVEGDGQFSMPKTVEVEDSGIAKNSLSKNSMDFIGVDKIHNSLFIIDDQGQPVAIKGQGVKVGIIDSGIDYTHSMFAGSGNVADFEGIDPTQPNSLFPNTKVVGGYDFAGKSFNTGSHLYSNKVPTPDANPLDQGGHGTHVAGTVAGVGDGVNTHDGAAPEADLLALKVFGDEGGSTSDTVVIAALEFAVDPNQDLDLSDKLDVVNLSLGGSFGKPHNLYSKAIANVVEAGVVVVAAAGNSGPISSIVGAPSTADAAISVAASVDHSDHNFKFPAVEFQTSSTPELLAQAIEGANTKSIESSNVTGELAYIGVAANDLTQEQKDAVNGKVALIDRGLVAFDDKMTRAVDAGAIGIVMVNNQPGDAIVMGGDDTFNVPGIMVTQSMGDVLKKELDAGVVSIQFQTGKEVVKPELIDTLTSFSSQGPRDIDGAIKPELAAPGLQIVSASIGSGNGGTKLNGTSMASPHVAGVAALLVQYKKDLPAKDIKSLLMNTSTLIDDENQVLYPISRQGAGRVQAYKAAMADVIVSSPSLSLGKVAIDQLNKIEKQITLKNIGESAAQLNLKPESDSLGVFLSQQSVRLAPGEETTVDVEIFVKAPSLGSVEMDAFIAIEKNGKPMGNIPIMAVANVQTEIQLTSLQVAAEQGQSVGADANLVLGNFSSHDGRAFLFNALGHDGRKDGSSQPGASVDCDLESAGFRVVDRDGAKILQVAAKIYNQVSTWNTCDINVLIDKDQDGAADLEINGTGFIPGLEPSGLVSAVFDSVKLRELQAEHQLEVDKQEPQAPQLDITPAILSLSGMVGFQHSTIAIVEANLDELGLTSAEIGMNLNVVYNGGTVVEGTDYLGAGNGSFQTVKLSLEGGAFAAIPEIVELAAGQSAQVQMKKGEASGDLIAYFPRNGFTQSLQQSDVQSQLIKPEFKNSQPQLLP